jgi:hypothetical protein
VCPLASLHERDTLHERVSSFMRGATLPTKISVFAMGLNMRTSTLSGGSLCLRGMIAVMVPMRDECADPS